MLARRACLGIQARRASEWLRLELLARAAGLYFADASIAGASVEAIRHYENQNRGLRNGRFDYSRQLALPSHVLKADPILIIAAAIAWGQMRDSGFSSSFFSVAFCFCWRDASLDFIAAIAHCVPTNTDAMVFIIGKPT